MSRSLHETIDRARDLLGLRYADVASALQVHESTLYRWRTGQSEASDRARERATVLAGLMDRLDEMFSDPEELDSWLDSPLAGLGPETPRRLLTDGRADLLVGYLLGRERGESRPAGRSLGRLHDAVRSAPHPMLLSTGEGEILELSDAVVELTGYSREELRTIQDWIRRACPSGSAEPGSGTWSEGTAEAGESQRERRIRTRSGAMRVWELTDVRLDPLPDGRELRLSTAVDVTDRKRALLRMGLLADAGAVLAERRDADRMLASLADLMTETLADFAIAYLLEDGRLYRVAHRHRDPDREAVLDEFERRVPLSEDLEVPRRLFESGEPVLVAPVEVEALATGPEHARLLESLSPTSGIGVPMIGQRGPIGIFTVATVEDGRSVLDEEDLTTVAEIARRAALVVENLRLRRDERRAREAAERRARRISALQRATATLSRAATPEAIRRALVEDAAGSVGAVGGALILAAEDGGWLEVVHSDSTREEVREEWSRIPASSEEPSPARQVIRTGRALFISTPEEWNDRYPGLAGLLEDLGGRSIAYVPVEVEGRRSGALALRFPEEREFPSDERNVLLSLGELAGQGLERARLYQSEREAREEAEVASVAKSQFLSVVSHELRTPLNGILGSANLLEEEIPGGLNDEQREHVRRIRGGAEHLTSLIEEIISYARSESAPEEPSLREVDLTRLAREIGALLEPRAADLGLALRLQLPEEPVRAVTDPGKLRHVLLNLLDNAIKFTDEGWIRLALERTGDEVELTVEDTGPGIPSQDRDRIFEPFVQLDQSRTRTRGGTGLGLAMVARQVELLGGTVTVEGGPDGGAVFRILHPLGRDPSGAEGAAP